MFGAKSWAACIALFGLCACARAETVTVWVAEDESVVSDLGPDDGTGDGTNTSGGYPTLNPHFDYYPISGSNPVVYKTWIKKGVLWSGVYQNTTGLNRTRFYLKFDLKSALPAIDPGMYIASATLRGYYYEDLYALDATHEIYSVKTDAWSEKPLGDNPANLDQGDASKGITWNNQPLLDPTDTTKGSLLQTFSFSTLTPGTYLSWDITSAVVTEYAGDGVLSLMFKAVDEKLSDLNLNFEKFQEQDCGPEFVICLQVLPIPAPSVLVGLLGMGATWGLALAWRRRRAAAK